MRSVGFSSGHDGPIKGHGSKESLLGDSSSSDAKKAMERDLKAAELRRIVELTILWCRWCPL